MGDDVAVAAQGGFEERVSHVERPVIGQFLVRAGRLVGPHEDQAFGKLGSAMCEQIAQRGGGAVIAGAVAEINEDVLWCDCRCVSHASPRRLLLCSIESSVVADGPGCKRVPMEGVRRCVGFDRKPTRSRIEARW